MNNMKNCIVYILCDICYILGLVVSIVQKNILGIGAYSCLIMNGFIVMMLYKSNNIANDETYKLLKENVRLHFLLDFEKDKNKYKEDYEQEKDNINSCN